MSEELYDIKDSEGNVVYPSYKITRDGRIWNGKKFISTTAKPSGNRVRMDGKEELVHQLVARTFIPNPSNHPFVTKLEDDSDKVENLKWISRNEKGSQNTMPPKCFLCFTPASSSGITNFANVKPKVEFQL